MTKAKMRVYRVYEPPMSRKYKQREQLETQAIEARSGKTGTGLTEGESAVGKADAPE